MQALTAKVRNGRLVLDEPTNLPEGAEVRVALVDTDDLTDEERAEVHASIERGILDGQGGERLGEALLGRQPQEAVRLHRAIIVGDPCAFGPRTTASSSASLCPRSARSRRSLCTS